MRTSPLVSVYLPCDLSNNDGFNSHVRALIDLFVGLGCEVNVIGFSRNAAVIPNVSVQIRNSGPAGMLLAAATFVARMLRDKPSAIVLTSAGSILNPLLCAVASLIGASILYDCHDPAVEAVTRIYNGRFTRRLLKRYLLWAEKVIDRFATVTLSVSPGLTRLLRSRGWSGRIELYYNAHNARFASRMHWKSIRSEDAWADAILLVYVGGMQRNMRGLEDQFEAINIARRDGVDARFVVAYGSGHPEQFEAFSTPLATQNAYKELAHVDAGDIMDLLRDCDVAINKTLPIALPSKIFEYVASGLVVLSIDDGSDVNEIFRDFVTIIRDEPHSMASAIASIDTSAEVRAARRARGEQFVDRLLEHNRAIVSNFVASLTSRCDDAQGERRESV